MMHEYGELLKGSFSNPFDDFNASLIDTDRILEYWCDPIVKNQKDLLSVPAFYSNKMPFIIQGSRGSGKTMLFKYFSYEAQKKIGKENGKIIDHICACGGVGLYFRCDSSFINALKAVCINSSLQEWENVFSYYMEMHISKNIINFVKDLEQEGELEAHLIDSYILNKVISVFQVHSLDSLDALLQKINKEIRNIQSFKDTYLFLNESFYLKKCFVAGKLEKILISALKECVPAFNSINFILMVDEYESLPIELQKSFNTMMKYADDSISLRIGRRTEINIATATINDTEYLRLNHDYILIDLDEKVDISDAKKYFFNVAQKRISSFIENSSISIKTLLGDEEDLVEECIEVAKGKKDHIIKILQTDASLKKDEIDKICENIKFEANPIMEMINALWIIRSKSNDKLETSVFVRDIMFQYLRKEKTAETKKYHNDYQNKYRYTLTVLLCSIYKKNKLYYGFNTVAHLSNGNTRTFINICREIVSEALFFETDAFFENKTISPSIQSKAIHKFSSSEFDDICSIIQHGDSIRKLILNLGNTFALFHKDRKARYPETNQFVVDQLSLEPLGETTLRVAQRWSLIIKKAAPQRLSVDINKRGDVFHINRVFSPLFNISYRTRGGFNISIDASEFSMMCSEIFTPSMASKILNESTDAAHSIKKAKSKIDESQVSLFDTIGDDADE